MQDNIKTIAQQRVQTLFTMAEESLHRDPTAAQEYVKIARKIAMAAKIRLPKQHRNQICKHCKSFIMPGLNCRTRLRQRREPHIVITCLNCGKHTRIPISKRRDGQGHE